MRMRARICIDIYIWYEQYERYEQTMILKGFSVQGCQKWYEQGVNTPTPTLSFRDIFETFARNRQIKTP